MVGHSVIDAFKYYVFKLYLSWWWMVQVGGILLSVNFRVFTFRNH